MLCKTDWFCLIPRLCALWPLQQHLWVPGGRVLRAVPVLAGLRLRRGARVRLGRAHLPQPLPDGGGIVQEQHQDRADAHVSVFCL